MFVLATAVAVLCAAVGPRYIEQRRIETMTQFGGQVFTEPRSLFLLRQFVGDDIAERAVYVHVSGTHVTDEWMKNIRGLKHIEVLSVRSPAFTDAGLSHLKALPNLASLNLVDTQVTDAGLAELRAELPRLRLVIRRPED